MSRDSEVDSIYKPLDQSRREIRLLRRIPGSIETLLHLQIAVLALDDKPSYRALSYCWTREDATCSVQCNGIRFWIRRNLFDFLESLSSEDEHYWLFVDAISINQRDVREKELQIGLMRDIYANAEEVVAWMGDESLQFRMSETISENVVKDYAKARQLGAPNPFATMSREIFREFFALSFMRWQYWSRLWIVQELVLAKRILLKNALFKVNWEFMEEWLIEDEEADGNIFDRDDALDASLIRQRLRNQGPTRDAESKRSAAAKGIATKLSRTRRKLHEHGGSLPIWQATLSYAHQETTEIRDRVFGLLGLLDSVLQPDYGMPILELYLRGLVEGFAQLEKQQRLQASDDDDEGEVPYHVTVFVITLLSALGLKVESPSTALVTLEALHTLYSYRYARAKYRQRVTRGYHLFWSLDRGPKLWYRKSRLGIWFQGYLLIDHQLARMEAKDLFVPGLPGPNDTKTYSRCVEWCQEIISEVLEAIEAKQCLAEPSNDTPGETASIPRDGQDVTEDSQ